MRTFNAQAINAIANHPEVRPWVGMPRVDDIDLTPQVRNPANFAFVTPKADGCYLLFRLDAGLYAAHSLAVPEARGKPMLKLMRYGFEEMFTATDAVEIVTQLPDGNLPAQAWASLAGFRETYRRESFFPLMGELVGCQFASLDYQTWAVKDRVCLQRGKDFHALIEPRGLANHPPDPVHDAFVGATILTIQRQNIHKGISLFNRYAALAGYHPASIVSARPPVVDTGDALLTLLANGDVSVLESRN